MGIFKKKDKTIKLYALYKVYDEKQFPLLVTVVGSKDNISECITRLQYLENFEHFNAWCELHNVKGTSKDKWLKYVETGILDSDIYKVREVKYSASDIASLLRMQLGCKPIGVSYENQEEVDSFNKKVEIAKRLNSIASMIDEKEE